MNFHKNFARLSKNFARMLETLLDRENLLLFYYLKLEIRPAVSLTLLSYLP